MNYSKTVFGILILLTCFHQSVVIGQTNIKNNFDNKHENGKLEITGAIPGLHEGEAVYLKIWDAHENTDVLLDSSIVKNGKFYFNYYVEAGPRLFWIKFSKHKHIIAVPFDNEKVTITSAININEIKSQSAFQYLQVDGSESARQHLYLNYALYFSWYYSRVSIESKIRKFKDSTLNKENLIYISGLLAARKLLDKTIGEILKTQPVKEIIPEFFANLTVQFQRDSSFFGIYQNLSDKIKNSYYGKMMGEEVQLCIGQQAPDFTFNTPSENNVAFQKIAQKNKLTVISFWSNRSVDRKRINGELAKLYKKYHKMGFEVVSVSLDANPTKWKKVVEEDGIPGYMTCDFKEEEGPIAKLYHANAQDTINILVDSNGKIIGWDIDGVMLYAHLFQIFGE